VLVVPSCPHKTKPKAKRGVHGTYGVYLKKERKKGNSFPWCSVARAQPTLASSHPLSTDIVAMYYCSKSRTWSDLAVLFTSFPSSESRQKKEKRTARKKCTLTHARTRLLSLSIIWHVEWIIYHIHSTYPTYPIELHTRVWLETPPFDAGDGPLNLSSLYLY
jgi:hypothetical protein